MWTYRTYKKTVSSEVSAQGHSLDCFTASSSNTQNKSSDVSTFRKPFAASQTEASSKSTWFYGSLFYLIGLFMGGFLASTCSDWWSLYPERQLESFLSQISNNQYLAIYGAYFLSIWIHLTIIYCLAHWTNGALLLWPALILRGVGIGLFYAASYQHFTLLKGLLFQSAIFILPETISIGLILWVGIPAWNLSQTLHALCHQKAISRLSHWRKLLITRYRTASITAFLPCVIRLLGAFLIHMFL